jgi:hypothetical protein
MEPLTLNSFTRVFRNQFDEKGQAMLQAHTDFKALENWSSLQSLLVITALDESFGCEEI